MVNAVILQSWRIICIFAFKLKESLKDVISLGCCLLCSRKSKKPPKWVSVTKSTFFSRKCYSIHTKKNLWVFTISSFNLNELDVKEKLCQTNKQNKFSYLQDTGIWAWSARKIWRLEHSRLLRGYRFQRPWWIVHHHYFRFPPYPHRHWQKVYPKRDWNQCGSTYAAAP